MIALLAIVTMAASANPVDLATARQVGAKFLNGNTEMRADDVAQLQHVTTYRTIDNTPALFVFGNENGFVIVAADNRSTPILGYSVSGPFDIDNVPPALEAYLQHFVEQIQYGIENHLEVEEEIARQWSMVEDSGRIVELRGDAVAPLVTAAWGQGCYYNQNCPTIEGPCGHAYTGCGSIAMSQIMQYWKYPTTGSGSHSYTPSTHPEFGQQTANFGATTYQWSNMPNTLNSNSNAVATLVYHCGVAVDMNYGGEVDGGSFSYPSEVIPALTNYFLYSSDCSLEYKNDYTNSAWLALVKSSLNQGKPIYYSGYDSNYSGGHAFICDGYNESNQLHFNWGWDGYYNGFYALDALTPSGNDFSYYNMAFVNIHPPVNNSVTYQVTVTTSPTSGGSVTGAGSYHGYQQCTLTATPASGFTFQGWKENGAIVSTNATYSFPVRQNRNLTAVFSLSPVGSVSASYYPDPQDPTCNSAQVSWQVASSTTWSFDEGLENWTLIDADGDGHNWYHSSEANTNHGVAPTTSHSGTGHLMGESYCNATNTALTPNNFLVSPQKISVTNGMSISFWACAQDANYPAEHFGVAVSLTNNTSASAFTTIHEWTLTRSAGNWYQYNCDLSSYAGQQLWIAIRHFNVTDQFIINLDDITIGSSGGNYPAQTSLNEGFELGIPTDWTMIDGDGDGYQWEITGYSGHNSPTCASSASYINDVGALHPNNYLVSPKVALGGVFTFWACAQDASWAAEHFGVAVSTTTPTASAFTTVQEWTMTAKADPDGRPRGSRDQGNWYQFTVNLSSYSGQRGYIAIRHFNCSDLFYLNVDDISYGFGKDSPQIHYYRVYRTACSNTNPSNYVLVADQQTGTNYVDAAWGSLPFGSYKFGVCSVGAVGNESDILWSDCLDRGVGYTITASASPSQGGTVTGAGLYESGTTCTLNATPNTGYQFVNWTKNGTAVSTNASYSFTVTENATYIAHFELMSYTITASADPAEGGTVSGGGTYNHGTTCTLSVTVNGDYNFVNWTKNGTVVSSSPSYTFTVTESASYIAHFSQLIYYTIMTSADPEEGGTVNGGGTFLQGGTCTLTATPNTGYQFVNWTKNGTVVSSNASFSFNVTQNATYVAHFSINTYTINATANPADGGVVTGAGTYNYGSEVTLTVTPNDQYEFQNWTENGQVVSQSLSYSFTVTSNRQLVAQLSHVTDVEEVGSKGVKAYPNPAHDKLFVECGQHIISCELYSPDGALLGRVETEAMRAEIPLQNLPLGVYLVKLITEKQVLITRFVKE